MIRVTARNASLQHIPGPAKPAPPPPEPVRVRTGNKRPITTRERLKFAELWGTMTLHEISVKMKRSKVTLRKLAVQLGLT